MTKIPNVNGVAETGEEAGIIIALYDVSVKRMREGVVSSVSHYTGECEWLTQHNKKHFCVSHYHVECHWLSLHNKQNYAQLKLKKLASCS